MSRRDKRERDVTLLGEFLDTTSRLSPEGFLKVLGGFALYGIFSVLIFQAACYSLEDGRIFDWIIAVVHWFAGVEPS